MTQEKGKLWEWLHSLWIIWAIIPALGWIAFIYVGYRAKRKIWLFYGLIYFVFIVVVVLLHSNQYQTLIGILQLLFWVNTLVFSFIVRKKYLLLISAEKGFGIDNRGKHDLPVANKSNNTASSVIKEKESEVGNNKELIREKRKQLDFYRSKLKAFGENKFISEEQDKELAELRKTFKLTDEDLRDADIELARLRSNRNPIEVKTLSQIPTSQTNIDDKVLSQSPTSQAKKEDDIIVLKCKECNKLFSPSFWDKLSGNTTICSECRQKKKEHINRYKSTLEQFGKDNYLSEEEEKQLSDLKSSLNLTDEDLKETTLTLEKLRKLSPLHDFEHKLNQEVDKYNVTREKIDEMKVFAQNIGLTPDDIAQQIQMLEDFLEKKEFCEKCLSMNFDVIDNPPVMLKNEEEAYFVSDVEVLQQTTKTVSHRLYAGTRFKIGNMPLYIGGSTPITQQREVMNTVGTGNFIITNKRIILVGTKLNYSIQLDKILDIDPFADALQINYEGKYGGCFYALEKPWQADMILTTLIQKL